ncbi:flagellar basal body protein [Demequina capsici]|uniref:Flagellar basal body rod protein FlgB n=1 Tax=Demequina capsici TaxID=3075620 RepID=A0AA96F6K1_9MICO|nr:MULTISPECIES: flagellar basal body protein [unclassified Demequina]WNM24549.1 flagellar basal body protein [Demequina sp. OYTSA14]WNM27400.1 flagellar basal body protein [Demequina sp. PMTSA13]
MFGSVSFDAMSSALDALSLRQQTIADNIANVQTPGYQARRVAFEDALKSAVARGSGQVSATVGVSVEPTREDGNNVNLDTETVSNIDTGLRYQLASQAMSNEFSQLRTAIGNA